MKPWHALVVLTLALALCPACSGADAAQPPARPSPAAPQRIGMRALAEMVFEGKGTIPYAIRKTVRDEDDILAVNWPPGAGPQHSVTLYSFAGSHLAPEKLTTLIRFKPDLVLVNGGDIDDEVPHAEMGARYEMHEGGYHCTLVVTDVKPAYFTLADSARVRPGSVTYGSFKDAAGELWLFEECVGEAFTDTTTFFGLHSKPMVHVTHKAIQAAITLYIDDAAQGSGTTASDDGPCPAEFSSHYEFSVNSRLDTEITVKPGDRVTISASGLVTLGIFAGQGGPEGIQFNPMYSIFPDSPHGCLIGRVRTSSDEDAGKWAYVGKGDTWNVKDTGTVELDLNDNDQGNNSGGFQVEITVCKAH